MRFILLFMISSLLFADPLNDLQNKVDKDLTNLEKDYQSKRTLILKKHVVNLEKLREIYTKRGDFKNAIRANKALEQLNPVAIQLIDSKWYFPHNKINVITLLADGKILESNKKGSIKEFWEVKDGSIRIWPTKQFKDGILYKLVDQNTLQSKESILKRVK